MRKILISFLALLIITVTVINPNISYADAPKLERISKGALGERVLIAVGEKAGVKYSSKEAYQKAVERWNMELYEQQLKAEAEGNAKKVADLKVLQGGLKDLKPEDVKASVKPGFVEYVMDASIYLLAVGVFLDVVTSIEDAVANEQQIEIVEEYMAKVEEGKAYTKVGPYVFYTQKWSDVPNPVYIFGSKAADDLFRSDMLTYGDFNRSAQSFGQFKVGTLPTGIITKVDGNRFTAKVSIIQPVGGTPKETTTTFTMNNPDIVIEKLNLIDEYNKSMWLPNPSNIPSVPSVPWVAPWRDNPDTNKPVIPEEIPLEVPLSDPDIYSPEQPWNDPMPIYDPVPGDQPDKDYIPGIPIYPNPDPGTNPNPDTGGDTNPDTGGDTNPDPGGETNPDPGSQPDPGGETNPNPDPGTGNPGTPGTEPPTNIPGGPPTPTNPLSWIWIFLQFLFAVIHFILRLGQFILTIPFIPQQQFPGVYGEMVKTFMNLEYGNIHPYRIMISVVNLAFGFVVYKILRRVFNG